MHFFLANAPVSGREEAASPPMGRYDALQWHQVMTLVQPLNLTGLFLQTAGDVVSDLVVARSLGSDHSDHDAKTAAAGAKTTPVKCQPS